MDHDAPWSLFGRSNAFWHEYGGWGVYLFFAISGLLVCTRILEDEALLGRFHLRSFYVRRFFRIQPPAFAYLAVVALLTLLGLAHERVGSILGALFLYQNYNINLNDVSGRWFLTGHFWTLAVEEHFYLLLSGLLFLFPRRRLVLFTSVVLSLYAFHLLAQHYQFDNSLVAHRHTERNLEYLFTPALLALMLRQAPFREFLKRYLQPWVAFSCTVFAKLLWLHFHPVPPSEHSLVYKVLDPPDMLLYSFDLWVVATMLHPSSLTTRLLETKFLRYIGRLSYSIYLWHALFIIGRLPQVALRGSWLIFLTERPWRYVATAVAAMISYYWIERPCMRLGHRLAPPATPGHIDLSTDESRDSLPTSGLPVGRLT